MNQRSISTRPKPKLIDVSFQQKISRAILHKKNIIAKMTARKTETAAFSSYRLSPLLKTKPPIASLQNSHSTGPRSVTHCSEAEVKEYLEDRRIYAGACADHPSKRAVFEQRDKRDQLFCHECAIRMVKNNLAVSSITPQSLMLKQLLEEQLQQIHQAAAAAHSLIDQHFRQLSSTLEKAYSDFMQIKVRHSQSATLYQFHQDPEMLAGVKEALGGLQEVRFVFGEQEDKENKSVLLNRSSCERECLQVIAETNRSLEAKTQREPYKQTRGREYSEYLRRDQPRKTLRLR